MDSTSSRNSTTNSSIITFDSMKDRVLSVLKADELDEKELLTCSQDLMAIPNLDDDIIPSSESLFDLGKFEISHKKKVNPIFIRNLLNIIQIINFIWVACKNNADILHNTLLKLGIMFSYLFRNEKDDKDGVDYALLAPIPNFVYDFIAKNGINSFRTPNKFSFEEEFFCSDNSDTQIGYVYQEASVSKILSNLDLTEVNICPKIMYYLEYSFAKELFNKNIINSPKNYLSLIHHEKEFKGYNEIDFSFSLSETAKIKENFAFNIVKKINDNYILRSFEPNKSNDIILEKDTNIFMEMKTSVKNANIDAISTKLKDMSQRFFYGYKNTAYSALDKKFSRNKMCYFLLYDDNRIELFNKIIGKVNVDKEVQICYNSIYAPLSSIVSLQNQIRVQDDKIAKLQKENDFKFSVIKIRLLNGKEKYIQKTINKCIETNSLDPLKIFKVYNTLFIESSILLKNIIPPDDIIFLNDQIIGQKEIPPNYVKLIMLLENKIKEKTFAADYYMAYRNALTGRQYIETKGNKMDYPICSEEIAEILKNFLKFICLLDKDPLLLNCLYGAILYNAIAISKSDKTYIKIYLANFKNLDIKGCVIYLIQSTNPSYIPPIDENIK